MIEQLAEQLAEKLTWPVSPLKTSWTCFIPWSRYDFLRSMIFLDLGVPRLHPQDLGVSGLFDFNFCRTFFH